MTAPTTPAPSRVQPGELAAIRLIAAGYTVSEAARRAGVSRTAMAMRLFRLRDAIGARTNTHAVVILARAGLLNITTETTR